MRKSNRQTFTCVGINSTISIIRSKRFQIEKVLMLKNSQAEKNQSLRFWVRPVRREWQGRVVTIILV